MFACPICGKDSNRRGDPFDSPEKVIAHVDGSHDDDHQGVRGEELREEIEATTKAVEDAENDVEASDAAQESAEPDEPRETRAAPDDGESENDLAVEDENVEELVETTYEAGGEEGYGSSFAEAQQDTSGGSSSRFNGSTLASDGFCPECGSTLDYGHDMTLFFAVGGRVLTLEGDDGICESCDVVVSSDGQTFYGNESKHGESTFPCGECGESVLDVEHARTLLAVDYAQTSSLAVFGRRSIRKMDSRIEKYGANYVCVNCWALYG